MRGLDRAIRVVCVLGLAACGQVKSSNGGPPDADVDASIPPDVPAGPAAFKPVHVLAATLLAGAPDLVLSGAGTIDTTALTINGATSAFFVRQDPYAVLLAAAFSVQNPIKITGSAPLIVVATDRVTIDASIDLHAVGSAAGPGAATAGAGVGGAGSSFLVPNVGERESSGGGGGSYGSLGGPGGSSDTTHTPAGASGTRYGAQLTEPLIGGSPGGAGGFVTLGGGGGGGALQISSAVSITIAATINAGGGGGATGGTGLAGGSGGGAGGEILLEAPTITMMGSSALVAAGGGGGGGGANGSMPGSPGNDGPPGPGVASGGAGGVPQGSAGGAGAGGTTTAFAEAVAGGNPNSKAGGGGGGAGRIWLRYRASSPPTLRTDFISPPAGMDSTLP
jgi:hypothetical protein